jgi:hypothetical protein
MSEYTFQEAMVRFLAEEEVRSAVYSNDANLQSKLGLIPEHVERLSQIDPERAEFFAGTVEFKHLYIITRHIPFTCKILGDENIRLFTQEFHSGNTIKNSDRLKHSLAFAEYLKDAIDANAFPAYTGDVLEYEINKIKFLIKQSELPGDVAAKNGLAGEILKQSSDSDDWLNMIPERSANHHIFRLESNIFDVLKKLSLDEAPPPANQQSVYVLLYTKDKGIVGDIIINSPTIKFITACNGKDNLDAIIREFAGLKSYDNSERFSKVKGECVELCKGLIRLGVIKPLPTAG